VKIKTDFERFLDLLFPAAVALLVIGLAVMYAAVEMSQAEAAEGRSVEYLERRVWELERSLSMYTNAGAVIVFRDEDVYSCALAAWDAVQGRECGNAWFRWRQPIPGGGTVTYHEGEVPR